MDVFELDQRLIGDGRWEGRAGDCRRACFVNMTSRPSHRDEPEGRRAARTGGPLTSPISPLPLGRETPQRPPHIALTQPLERAVAKLTDAFAGDAEHRPDLLEGVLAAPFEPEVEP